MPASETHGYLIAGLGFHEKEIGEKSASRPDPSRFQTRRPSPWLGDGG